MSSAGEDGNRLLFPHPSDMKGFERRRGLGLGLPMTLLDFGEFGGNAFERNVETTGDPRTPPVADGLSTEDSVVT